jgi:hypothetical protein
MPEALPYRGASDDHVRAGAWTVVVDGEPKPMPSWLEEWDYAMPISARRQVELDCQGIRDESGLDESTAIGLVVTWRVTGSLLNGLARPPRVLTLDSGTTLVDLSVDLAGTDLGPAIELETVLVLLSGSHLSAAPIASRAASALWRDKKKMRLLGGESQFPLAIVNFAPLGLQADAPWWLVIGVDLEAPAMGQVQLLINERFAVVVAAVKDEAGTPSGPAIRSALRADVGRTLVERALSEDEVLDRDDWPDDSLGEVLRAIVRSRVGGQPADLKREMETDPVAWAARMAGTFHLFSEVTA